ncbi:MAG: tryptophan 2,3-dioxygenase [Cyclobacteriaceae bacterium]|nr:tryptophan 2,3-dioxygenase [Cyclobacteriaceae bacterium HetDA_MAG_MS6]
MEKEPVDPSILSQLKKLEDKYEAMGQDLSSYLDGLLYSDYLTYWDYVHLDTLLSLQTPRTDLPDERIFILYHQITELYFRLILNEQEQAIYKDPVDESLFLRRIQRINRYFGHLIDSFDIMIEGMDPDQFLTFRMSLLPSSGFQSAQYRMIEINSTDFHLLVSKDLKKPIDEWDSFKNIYNHLYWKKGATELATGKKTLTLKQFEKKYSDILIRQAKEVKEINLRRKFLTCYEENKAIKIALKQYDHHANVLWPLSHFKSAARYLHRDPKVIKATGGTNWQKYLPPRRQMITYFPELWTEEELSEWGVKLQLENL